MSFVKDWANYYSYIDLINKIEYIISIITSAEHNI